MRRRQVSPRFRTALPVLGERFVELDVTRLIERKRAFVYLLIFRDEVVYVGQTGNSVDARVASHISKGDKLFERVLWTEVPPDDADAYEGALIRELRPKHNYRHTGRVGPEDGRRTPKDTGRDDEILTALGLMTAALKAVP